MIFTIFNYATPNEFQSFYFNYTINNIKGCKSQMFANTSDAYDIYDRQKPDYSIINITRCDVEPLIHYNSKSKNPVKHLISLDGLLDEHIPNAEKFINDRKEELQCKLVFGSSKKLSSQNFGVPYVHIPYCADDNLVLSKKYFTLEKAIIINNPSDIKDYDGEYHMLSNYKEEQVGDIAANNMILTQILPNYDKVVFRNVSKDTIPELFFTSLYFGNKTYFDNDKDSSEIQSVLRRMIDAETSFDYNKQDIYNLESIREKIKEKHMPRNRFKTLISQLSNTQNIIQEMQQ